VIGDLLTSPRADGRNILRNIINSAPAQGGVRFHMQAGDRDHALSRVNGVKFMLNREQNSDRRNSPAHLLLLSKFRAGASLKSFHDADHWATALKEKPSEVIEHFVKEGLLEPTGLLELVAYKFKTSDLKSILKGNGLKVSGRKDELIQRLVDNNAQAMCEATKDIDLYQCTAVGAQLAESYLAAEKTKRECAERDVLDLLGRGEYSEAVRVVAQFEALQVFPRGMGIDWKNHDWAPDIESLKTIFNSTPAILLRIDELRLKQLRLAAGMMQLWGTNTALHWFPEGIDTGINLDWDAACRMFVFHSSYIRNMTNYREMGARTVEVLGVIDENTCSECRRISGKKYPLASVPELPFAKCTSEIGCRCTTVIGDFR